MPNRHYKLCVVGFAHMHVNELVDRFLATGRCDIVACADTVPRMPSAITVEGSRAANLRRALDRSGARHYPDWRDMLAQETDLDIALFAPEITRHAEVAEALAARGLHMVTEKPMAATLADARRMAAAAQHAGVRLAVNWPITWRPAVRQAQALVAGGTIGAVRNFRWRTRLSLGPLAPGSTHPGDTVVSGPITPAQAGAEWWYQASEGGGALLDYCCYGACLAAWMLGAQANSVQGMAANLASPFGDVEDNAALLVRFPEAMAVIEASWTTPHPGVANGPIMHGSKGTLVVDNDRVRLHRDATSPPETFAGDPLPVAEADLGEAFLHHIETGAPLHPTLDLPLNLQAVAILDAGARAAATGRAQDVERV